MRPLVLAVALLSVPVLPAGPQETAGPVPMTHEFFVPYMHLGALDIPSGIRPGAWVRIGTHECTASFVVRDAAGKLYLTTAAHCTDAVGQHAFVTQDAPVGAVAEPLEFGTLVARWPTGLDAALIAIDSERYGLVNPSMPGWGGPTGLETGIPAQGTVTLHYGWGWVTWYEHQTRCRPGVLDFANAAVWWTNEIGGGGDSGSAVMTQEGRALGILTAAAGTFSTYPLTTAYVATELGGVRFDRVLAAWAAEGWDLSLVTGGPVNAACLPEPPV